MGLDDIDAQDFTRFEFKMSLEQISLIVQYPRHCSLPGTVLTTSTLSSSFKI